MRFRIESRNAEKTLIPHLDAAYNLARWLLRNEQDARDVLQESFVRALRSFDSMEAEDAKPWLLKIVRNTCYTWLERNRHEKKSEIFDEEIHTSETTLDPEFLLLLNEDVTRVRSALEALGVQYREALVLRELEGMSYEEISRLLEVPIGTVMSRISRARTKVQKTLKGET